MQCPYSKILGERGKGFHEQRLFGFALNDVIGTIGLGAITTYFSKIDLWKTTLGWFIAGEIMHYGFGVDTAVMSAIGVKPCEDINEV